MLDEDCEEHEAVMGCHGECYDPDDTELTAVEAMHGRIGASRRKGPAKGGRTSSNKVWTKRP